MEYEDHQKRWMGLTWSRLLIQLRRTAFSRFKSMVVRLLRCKESKARSYAAECAAHSKDMRHKMSQQKIMYDAKMTQLEDELGSRERQLEASLDRVEELQVELANVQRSLDRHEVLVKQSVEHEDELAAILEDRENQLEVALEEVGKLKAEVTERQQTSSHQRYVSVRKLVHMPTKQAHMGCDLYA